MTTQAEISKVALVPRRGQQQFARNFQIVDDPLETPYPATFCAAFWFVSSACLWGLISLAFA